jgi:hypothetical protein
MIAHGLLMKIIKKIMSIQVDAKRTSALLGFPKAEQFSKTAL